MRRQSLVRVNYTKEDDNTHTRKIIIGWIIVMELEPQIFRVWECLGET